MIFVLNRHEEIIATLSNESPQACPYWDDELNERLVSGSSDFSFACPATHEDAQMISLDGYVIIKNLDEQLLMFRIQEVEDSRGENGERIRRVYAENIGMELLGDIVRPSLLEGVTTENAMSTILAGTQWQVGVVEYADIATIDISDYPTVLNAVQRVAESFNQVREFFNGADYATLDPQFRVVLTGSRVTGRYVDLYTRGGFDGKRFEYGQDIRGIIRTENRTNLVTAMVGAGQADEDGVIRTFAEVTAPQGFRYRKEAGLDYIEDRDALERWSPDGRHIFGIHKTEETDPLAIMYDAARELDKRNKPEITYEMDVELLERLAGDNNDHERVRLGSTVIITDHTFEPALVVSARVVEMRTSLSDPQRDEIKLANFREIAVGERELLQRLRDRFIFEREQYLGDGIYKGNTPPPNPKVGDLWLDTSVEPNVLYRWNGSEWVKVGTDLKDLEDLRDEIEEVLQPMPDQIRWDEFVRKFREFEARHATNLEKFDLVINDELLEGLPKETLQNFRDALVDRFEEVEQIFLDRLANGLVSQIEAGEMIDAIELYTFSEFNFNVAIDVAYRAIEFAKVIEEADRARDEALTEAREEYERLFEEAREYTETYAERRIFRQSSTPTGATNGDLWLNSTTTPPQWYQYDGTNWAKITRSDLSELTGQISASQIAANVITSNMISTAGLSAGVITTGVMEGARINAGTITATQLASDSVTSNKIMGEAVTAEKISADAVTASKILAGSIDTSKISALGIEADVITSGILDASVVSVVNLSANNIVTGTLTGRRVEVSNAGISEQGTGGGSVRFYAGSSFSGRTLAPFRVTQAGNVFAENLTSGNEVNIGFTTDTSQKILRFSNASTVSHRSFGVGNLPTIYISAAATIFDGQSMGIATNGTENGVCGIGGISISNGANIAGTMVNFRMGKTYTPSSISLQMDTRDSVGTNVSTAQISSEGFWLFISNTSTVETYRFWRGRYTA